MFGNKDEKRNRLQQMATLVQKAGGITQAELARRLGVTRGTVNKDLSIVQDETGALFWEDEDGRLYPFEE
jgi:DeoR/GlpR family transcriptional regulator of sugar metabolism